MLNTHSDIHACISSSRIAYIYLSRNFLLDDSKQQFSVLTASAAVAAAVAATASSAAVTAAVAASAVAPAQEPLTSTMTQLCLLPPLLRAFLFFLSLPLQSFRGSQKCVLEFSSSYGCVAIATEARSLQAAQHKIN